VAVSTTKSISITEKAIVSKVPVTDTKVTSRTLTLVLMVLLSSQILVIMSIYILKEKMVSTFLRGHSFVMYSGRNGPARMGGPYKASGLEPVVLTN
jgi:hypothetical protein